MNFPNVVGIPIPDYATRVPQDGGALGSPSQANAFTQAMTSAEQPHDDCVGTINEVNLDEFFAAWGSNDSAFDIDNSGTVDAQDLSHFLGMTGPAGPPAPGSVEDVQSQWGALGHSTADLNGDYVVDGLDLALSLGDTSMSTVSQPAETVDNPLQSLLDNWGTSETNTDLNGDGNTSGSDLTILLAGLSSMSQADTATPPQVSPVAQQIFDTLNQMGFEDEVPINIDQVIDGLRMGTFESKAVTMDLLELYGKNSKSDGREGRVSRR